MEKPEVEFFSEDVEGVEYLNVGFKFHVPEREEPVRCVLGAFSGEVDSEFLIVVRSLVEEAAIYMQGVYTGEMVLEQEERLGKKVLVAEKPQLTIVGGG